MEKLFIYWSRQFIFPFEHIKEVREWEYDMDVGFHTMAPPTKGVYLTSFGTAHGKEWAEDFLVSKSGGVVPGIVVLNSSLGSLQPF